jgi:hypothetical protein
VCERGTTRNTVAATAEASLPLSGRDRPQADRRRRLPVSLIAVIPAGPQRRRIVASLGRCGAIPRTPPNRVVARSFRQREVSLHMDAVVTPISIAQIVWRNSAPIVGILFFHWSTTNVLVLYFLDTMLSFGVIFAGLAKSFSPAKPNGAGAWVKSEFTYVFVALLLCALFGIPLGMPVGLALGAGGFTFSGALADHSLRVGVLWQCAMALWSYIGLYRALDTHSPSELRLKQRFGLILMRWVVVLVVCYAGLGFVPGNVGVFLLVAAYVAASIFAEMAPDRFLRGTPADDSAEARAPSAAKNPKRRS